MLTAGEPNGAAPASADHGSALAEGQRLTFHPNISFRGPQVLRVRTGQG